VFSRYFEFRTMDKVQKPSDFQPKTDLNHIDRADVNILKRNTVLSDITWYSHLKPICLREGGMQYEAPFSKVSKCTPTRAFCISHGMLEVLLRLFVSTWKWRSTQHQKLACMWRLYPYESPWLCSLVLTVKVSELYPHYVSGFHIIIETDNEYFNK
jgi:hypothetical protein